MLKAKSVTQSFDIESTESSVKVDGEIFSCDLIQVDQNCFHIIHDQKSYRAFVVDIDREGKKVVLKINGNRYEVVLQDKFDLLLDKMGMNNGHAGRVNSIKAPMPGL